MGNAPSSQLHQAAAHNDVEEVERMFKQHDANVNDRDKDGWTPLHFAAYGGALEVTQFLLVRGANPAPGDSAERTPLHLAALQGHSTVASLLIGRGAPVNAKDENDMTPLHKAAIKGNVEVGEQLLRLGADPNGEVKDGTRPLHLAAWKNHVDFIRLLLSVSANVQATTKSGRTPLHEAAEAGNDGIVQLLISIGANPQMQDKDGRTAASLASHAGHKELAETLSRAAGNSSNISSQAGSSAPSAPPLHSGASLSGPIKYPDVYKPSEAQKEAKTNKDFWNQQLGDTGREKGRNQGFWGEALGGSGDQGSEPKKVSPWEESAKEAARNKEFWDKKLASGDFKIPKKAQDWDRRADKAATAWSHQIDKDTPAETQTAPGKQDPRKQFEQNVLKQAQGFWNMLQGKSTEKDERRWQEAQRKRREAQETDAEWGGGRPSQPSGWDESQERSIPRSEKYDLEPYDDDDYKPSGPSPAGKGYTQGSKSSAALQRRLAQLELDVDREQGWIRGGTKTDADEAAMRKNRIKDQEAEIAGLRRQLAGQHVRGGHSGRGGGQSTPAEYLCPITQEIMHDPVTAGDGYTYERGPIEKWLGSHNVSPMTGGKMPDGRLKPNQSLKSAIRQWQS